MPSAFPGAYGWGAATPGGRGGTVVKVTNTNDSGAGSFRAAIEGAVSDRIVVFTVAGTVTLLSAISITGDHITIAGQTAPGSGFWLRDGVIKIRGNHLIIRYLSWRGITGAIDDEDHFFNLQPYDGCHDVIIDHCSGAWSSDSMFIISRGAGDSGDPDMYNFTIQNCLLAETLSAEPEAMTIVGDNGADPALAREKIYRVSVHSNFFVHCGIRTPLCNVREVEFINNLIYNKIARGTMIKHEGEIDVINNYYQFGPATANDGQRRSSLLDDDPGVNTPMSVYLSGNIIDDFPVADGGPLTDPTADNWPFFRNFPTTTDTVNKATHDRGARLSTLPPNPVSIISAAATKTRVPSWAGNIHRLNSDGTFMTRRDALDQRVLDDQEDDTGPNDYATEGTMPTVDSGIAYTDTDGDGMSDEWEDLHGFDKNSALDGPTIASNGYSNVENFLNGKLIYRGDRNRSKRHFLGMM